MFPGAIALSWEANFLFIPGYLFLPQNPPISCFSQLKLELEQRASSSGRCRMEGEKFQNEGITNLHNLPGHQEVKLQGRKKACVHCSNHGRKTPSRHTPETTYGCNWCGVNLCRNSCFLQYHTAYSHLYATLKYIWYCYSPPMAIYSLSSSYPSPSHFPIHTIGSYKEDYA